MANLILNKNTGDQLTATEFTSIITAINERAEKALTGLLENLATTDKSTLVAAINELKAAISGVGNLSDTDIDTLAELNAILSDADVASQTWVTNLTGTLSNLTTTAKESLVDAINEIKGIASRSTQVTAIYPKTGHTYVAGDLNKYFNYSLSPALADTSENAQSLGFLKSINGDNLEFITKGDIDITGWLDVDGAALVVNTTYYLSNTVAGGLISETAAKELTSGVLLPILHTVNETNGQVLGEFGYEINADAVDVAAQIINTYPKTGHTYVAGDLNKYFNYSLSPALGDTTENAKGLGFLKGIDGDNLRFITKGTVDITGWLDHAGSALVAGTTYCLSTTAAGGLMTEAEVTALTEGIYLPVLHAVTSTKGQVLGEVGYELGATEAGGDIDASTITSGTLPDPRLSVNVTTQGNTFNGTNQLVDTNLTGLLADLATTDKTNLINAINEIVAESQVTEAVMETNDISFTETAPTYLTKTFTASEVVTYSNPTLGKLVTLTATGGTPTFPTPQLGVSYDGAKTNYIDIEVVATNPSVVYRTVISN